LSIFGGSSVPLTFGASKAVDIPQDAAGQYAVALVPVRSLHMPAQTAIQDTVDHGDQAILRDGFARTITYSNVNGHQTIRQADIRCKEGECVFKQADMVPVADLQLQGQGAGLPLAGPRFAGLPLAMPSVAGSQAHHHYFQHELPQSSMRAAAHAQIWENVKRLLGPACAVHTVGSAAEQDTEELPQVVPSPEHDVGRPPVLQEGHATAEEVMGRTVSTQATASSGKEDLRAAVELPKVMGRTVSTQATASSGKEDLRAAVELPKAPPDAALSKVVMMQPTVRQAGLSFF